jgi:hypothetical protein
MGSLQSRHEAKVDQLGIVVTPGVGSTAPEKRGPGDIARISRPLLDLRVAAKRSCRVATKNVKSAERRDRMRDMVRVAWSIVAFAAASLFACGDDVALTSSTGLPAGGGGAGGVGAGGQGGSSDCETLGADELANLTFGSFLGFYQAKPGDSVNVDLGFVECCYFFTAVDVCAAFSVEPADHASIDPTTGLLSISPTAPDGTELVVTADVQDGAAIKTISVFVYDPADNPLVGLWTEIGQIDCTTSVESAPPTPMQELAFWANGTFWATWMPFELYIDYTGSYSYDLATGELTLTPHPNNANYLPPDVDGVGTFVIENGELVLTDMWLGTPSGSSDPPACGHRFD